MNTRLTTIALVAILGGVILLIVSAATSDEGNQLLEQFQPAAQIISAIVLIGTVVVLYIQQGGHMNTRLTTIALVAILGGVILLIVSAATSDEGNQLLAQFQPAAQIISSIVLIGTVVVLYIQLGHIQEQNELQRNVASKSSIQALNEVILSKENSDFLLFIFPHLVNGAEPHAGVEQARKSMMAFSLMNSLEMLYLTQKEKVDREDFKRMLNSFTVNVRELWNDDFAAVYHPDFQEIVEEVFEEDQAQQAATPST